MILDDRITDIDSLKNRRLEALKQSGARGVVDAYKWVESHRNEFQNDVYGPLLIEVGRLSKDALPQKDCSRLRCCLLIEIFFNDGNVSNT